MGWNRCLSESKGVKQSKPVSKRDDEGECGVMAEGREKENAGGKSVGCEILGPYGRQKRESNLKLDSAH